MPSKKNVPGHTLPDTINIKTDILNIIKTPFTRKLYARITLDELKYNNTAFALLAIIVSRRNKGGTLFFSPKKFCWHYKTVWYNITHYLSGKMQWIGKSTIFWDYSRSARPINKHILDYAQTGPGGALAARFVIWLAFQRKGLDAINVRMIRDGLGIDIHTACVLYRIYLSIPKLRDKTELRRIVFYSVRPWEYNRRACYDFCHFWLGAYNRIINKPVNNSPPPETNNGLEPISDLLKGWSNERPVENPGKIDFWKGDHQDYHITRKKYFAKRHADMVNLRKSKAREERKLTEKANQLLKGYDIDSLSPGDLFKMLNPYDRNIPKHTTFSRGRKAGNFPGLFL